MKLVSSSDYGKHVEGIVLRKEKPFEWYFNTRRIFDNFLTQPLELWMFVPCRLENEFANWHPMKEPSKEMWDKFINSELGSFDDLYTYCFEYQQAKERCLFDGFGINTRKFNESDYKLIENKDTYIYFLCNIQNKWIKVNDYKTIKCLVLYNLQLTPNAIKQLQS